MFSEPVEPSLKSLQSRCRITEHACDEVDENIKHATTPAPRPTTEATNQVINHDL